MQLHLTPEEANHVRQALDLAREEYAMMHLPPAKNLEDRRFNETMAERKRVVDNVIATLDSVQT